MLVNELGSDILHARHQTALEEHKGWLRTRVLDQRLIDQLLLRSVIDRTQHLAADRYYQTAVRAGAFPGNQKMERGDVAQGSGVPRAVTLLWVDKYLRANAGSRIAETTWRIVVTERPGVIEDLRAGLDVLSDYFFTASPHRASTKGVPSRGSFHLVKALAG